MRHIRSSLLALSVLVGGCLVGPSARELEDAIAFGPDPALNAALLAYPQGSGRWPASVNELASSPMLRGAYHVDLFRSLTFTPSADGGLVVAFDGAGDHGAVTLYPPEAHSPPADRRVRGSRSRGWRTPAA